MRSLQGCESACDDVIPDKSEDTPERSPQLELSLAWMVHTSGSDRLFTYTDIFILVSAMVLAEILKGKTYRESRIGALVGVRIPRRRLGRRELDRECRGGRSFGRLGQREVDPPFVDVSIRASSASGHSVAPEQKNVTSDNFAPQVRAAEL